MSGVDKNLTEQFFSQFLNARTEFANRLESAKLNPPSSDELQALVLTLAKLRKDLTDATGFLPSYDQRQYESQLKVFEQQLDGLRTTSTSKPKFAFKRKAAAPKSSLPSTPASTPSPAPNVSSSAISSTNAPSAGVSLSDHSHTYLTWDSISIPNDLNQSDLAISNLDHCILNLLEAARLDVSVLHVRNVHRSILLLPMIKGSVMLHDLKECVFVLGCHQFRMHTSTSVDVYLSIPSNPIIEHCSRIRFTSYPSSLAQALPETSKHLSVQDFSHIRATPSPNWSALPQEDTAVDWPSRPLPDPSSVDAAIESRVPKNVETS